MTDFELQELTQLLRKFRDELIEEAELEEDDELDEGSWEDVNNVINLIHENYPHTGRLI